MHDLSEATLAWYNALPSTTHPMTEFGGANRDWALRTFVGQALGLTVSGIDLEPGRLAVYLDDCLGSEAFDQIVAARFRHEGRELRLVGIIADHESSGFMDECSADITDRIGLIYADDPRALKDAIRT